MNRDDTGKFEQVHLAQWLETSRHYLFPEKARAAGLATSSGATPSQPAAGQGRQNETDPLESDPDPAEKALLQLRLDTHGARVRFISRIRGNMLRRVKRTAQWNSNPLQELEHVFFSHVSFIARNPDVARHMLDWLILCGDVRIQRRVQAVVDCYVSRLAQRIERARCQDFIRADISPHFAANFFVSLIQGLALGKEAGLTARNEIFRKAAHTFALYRDWMAPSTAEGTKPAYIYIPAYFGWSRT
jgi:TetR/AcrR family transcriptional regulator